MGPPIMFKVLIAVVLLALLGVVHAEEPRLIVKKALLTTNVVAQKDLAINVQVFNVGDGVAHDVVLNDVFASDEFETVVGGAAANWEKIPAGGNVTHAFVVRPLNDGALNTATATVTYRAAPNGATKVSHSTPVPATTVHSDKSGGKQSAFQLVVWLKFGALALVPVLLPFLVWGMTQVNYEHGLERKS